MAEHAASTGNGPPVSPEQSKRHRRLYPLVADLRRKARSRIPRFAFDFVDGGANAETGVQRNMDALAAVELLPRFCMDMSDVSTETELFGRKYAAPFGIAPMGSPGLMWPAADQLLAREAQRARVPFVLSTPANAAIEEIAAIAPDVFWFQLYRFAGNDYATTFDLVRRAAEAGAHVLVPTIDSAGRSKRPRDIRNNIAVPFVINAQAAYQVATSPAWAVAMAKHGRLMTKNLLPYVGANPTSDSTALYMRNEGGGSHTWDELARLRERWPRAFVVKGILHPRDAERAAALGADGIIVSNHGGRHFDAAPATIDILPAIVAAVGSRCTVMIDSGIRSGLDILRALALGAKAAFAGRPYLYGLAALGAAGAPYVIDMFSEELRTEFQHVGVHRVADATEVSVRHPGAWVIGNT